MSGFAIASSVAGFALLAATLFSPYIKNRLYISEPAIFILLGIAVGPESAKLITIHHLAANPNTLLEEVARVTLAISVTGAALRLPPRYFSQRWGELTVLLTFGMLLMCAAGSLLAFLVLGM